MGRIAIGNLNNCRESTIAKQTRTHFLFSQLRSPFLQSLSGTDHQLRWDRLSGFRLPTADGQINSRVLVRGALISLENTLEEHSRSSSSLFCAQSANPEQSTVKVQPVLI